MTLLHLLRHAHAGDPERWEGPDAERPLSNRGRRQAARLGRLLAAADERPDLYITSPKVRARETADIVASASGSLVVVDDRLVGGYDLAVIDDVLAAAGHAERPCLVGHDPEFSELLGALLGLAPVPMRKGALAVVEIGRPLTFGRGTLRVLLPPELLRGLD